MFRIDKQLVQVAPPAQIPLIPVQQVETPAATTAKLTLPEQTEKLPREAQRAVDNLLKQAQRQAEAKLAATEKEAEAKLSAAAKEAERKIAAAQNQAKGILDQAKQKGYREGQQEGLALYQQQREEASQQLSRLFTELAEARETFFDSFEGETVELALAIAEKIVITAVNRDETAFQAMIVNALKHMRREGKISIRVSEQQYNEFFAAESASFVLGDESVRAEIVNDPLLSNGDLILESDGETVNAGAASQLKYIRLAFGRPGGGE